MDELPKITPDPSDIPKSRTEKERFPLNVFANCIGADGFNIMGCPVRITKKKLNTPNDDGDDVDNAEDYNPQHNKRRTGHGNNNNINTTSTGGSAFGKPMRLSRERLEAFL